MRRSIRTCSTATATTGEGGYKNPGGPPEIHLGNKGLLYVEYHVRTADIDAHSCNAAVVENPAWRLLQALSSLKDEKDHILIDGFYDDVIPVTEDDMRNLEEDNYDEAEQKEYLGISSYINDLTGVELRKKLYYAPTANIAGIISGYTGAGSKTVLPCEASAKMDFRWCRARIRTRSLSCSRPISTSTASTTWRSKSSPASGPSAAAPTRCSSRPSSRPWATSSASPSSTT